MFMVMSVKKMLRHTFSVFEPEQYMEMGNYKYSFDRNSSYLGRWNWCVVFLFFLVHPVYSKFLFCDYC